MMAPTTYFNWDTIQISNPETITFPEVMREGDLTPNFQHLFSSYSEDSLFLSNLIYEKYIDSTDPFLHPSKIDLPYDPLFSISDIFPTQEYYHLPPCPKRQKFSDVREREMHSSLQEFTTQTVPSWNDNYLDGFPVLYDNNFPPSQTEELQQQFISQLGSTCVDLPCEKKENDNIISPQSVAARERRRKVSEKTQNLGKLVPGGSNMNTADMLHAAAKYVKYLQVQVEMLELMKSVEEDKSAPLPEMLSDLVVSPFIQEKLYTEGRCIVSRDTVTTLTNLEHLQSRPTIVEDLKQLIGTDMEKESK